MVNRSVNTDTVTCLRCSPTTQNTLRLKSHLSVTERKTQNRKHFPEIWSFSENAYVDSKGFAKCSPGRPFGTRPLINPRHPQFLGSAEMNSRLFVPL